MAGTELKESISKSAIAQIQNRHKRLSFSACASMCGTVRWKKSGVMSRVRDELSAIVSFKCGRLYRLDRYVCIITLSPTTWLAPAEDDGAFTSAYDVHSAGD